MGADGAAGDDHAFDELVRGHFHQRPVLAGAGLALVGVAQDIFWLGGFLGDKTPFHSGGKAGAAAPAQVRFLDLFDHLLRRELFEGALQPLITVTLQVNVEFVRLRNAKQAADHGDFGSVALVHRAGSRHRSCRP